MSSALKIFGGNALISRSTWGNTEKLPAKRAAVIVPDWSIQSWEQDGTPPGSMNQVTGLITDGPILVAYGGNGGTTTNLAENANAIATSPDLLTWTARACQGALYGGCWMGTKFFVGGIAGGVGLGNHVGYTAPPAGFPWTAATLVNGCNRQPTYNSTTGMGIAFASNSVNYATTLDGGSTWTARVGPWGTHVSQCLVIAGKFFVVAINGIWYGTDGINWTAAIIRGFQGEVAPTMEFRGIAHNGTIFCAVAVANASWNPAYPISFTSTDGGVTFNAVAPLTTEGTSPLPMNDTVGSGAVVFSNTSITIRQSPGGTLDARRWDQPVMCTHNGRFVVSCVLTTLQAGTSTVIAIVLTSYDGEHWTTMEGGTILASASAANVVTPYSAAGVLNMLYYINTNAQSSAVRLVSNQNAKELVYVL